MLLIIFSLFLLSPFIGIPLNENGLMNWDEPPVGEINSLEDAIRELLEELRKKMKEGIPEENIPPMEPLLLSPMDFDFLIEDTTLDVYLKDEVISKLTDFDVKNLTVALMPKKRLAVDVLFPELSITGWHKLSGILFGEIPLDDSGSHRIVAKNLTLSIEFILRTKAGTIQISDLNADFRVQRISVVHRNPKESEQEKEIPESTVKNLLDRFRSCYLPLLLNTGKIYLNDLIIRLKEILDEEENLPILSAFLGKQLPRFI